MNCRGQNWPSVANEGKALVGEDVAQQQEARRWGSGVSRVIPWDILAQFAHGLRRIPPLVGKITNI